MILNVKIGIGVTGYGTHKKRKKEKKINNRKKKKKCCNKWKSPWIGSCCGSLTQSIWRPHKGEKFHSISQIHKFFDKKGESTRKAQRVEEKTHFFSLNDLKNARVNVWFCVLDLLSFSLEACFVFFFLKFEIRVYNIEFFFIILLMEENVEIFRMQTAKKMKQFQI